MSCWDHVFNTWLYRVAEENNLSIGRIDMDRRMVEDYLLEEALERYYERKEKQ